MKAAVVTELGGPDVIQVQHREIPEPGPEDVLIEVHAASVNFADIKARQGQYHGVQAESFIPGLDCAGIVVKKGERVTSLEVGDRVAAFPTGGSYAEYVCAPEVLTYAITDEVEMQQAAAALTVGITSWNVLHQTARLRKGESVLVHAGAGGIGTTAVHLAAEAGASMIITTVGSREKEAAAKKAGADHVLFYREESFKDRVLEMTDGAGVDLVLDTISGKNFEQSMICTAFFGRVVLFGHANEGSVPGQLLTTDLHASCRSVLGYSTGTFRNKRPEALRPAAEEIMKRLMSGSLKMPIYQSYALEEASEAHRVVEERQSTGKVLLATEAGRKGDQQHG